MAHWTQELKDENARLRAALDIAVKALREIPANRWAKYANAGHDEHAMAYRKAIEEVNRLNQVALDEVSDAKFGIA